MFKMHGGNILKEFLKRHSLIITVASICFLIDRLTKIIATHYLKGKTAIVIIKNFLNLTYVENTGAAFGLFANLENILRLPLLTGVALMALFFIIYLYVRLGAQERIMRLSLSLIFGGAIGNIYDRLTQGYVVDFIDVHYKRHFTWPAFNFADIVISVGAGLIILSLIIETKKEEEK